MAIALSLRRQQQIATVACKLMKNLVKWGNFVMLVRLLYPGKHNSAGKRKVVSCPGSLDFINGTANAWRIFQEK